MNANTIKEKKDIYRLYIYKLLDNFWLDRAIWVIFLLGRGFELTTIGFAETILHLSIFVSEIPTGSFADLLGRKWSLAVGSVLNAIAVIMMVVTKNEAVLYLSFALYGISITFRSGADDSLLYDYCKRDGITDKFKEIQGNFTSLFYLSVIVAQFIGGYVAKISFAVLYIIRVVSMILAAVWASGLKEVKAEKKEKINVVRHNQRAITDIINTPRLFPLMILYASFYGIVNIYTIMGQALFKQIELGTETIGIIYSLAMLASIFGAKWAAKIDNFFGSQLYLKSSFFVMAGLVCLWLMLPFPFNIIFFILINFHSSILMPIYSDQLNSIIESERRSTILSMRGALFSLVQVIGFPLVGYLVTKHSFQDVFGGCAILMLVVYVFAYIPAFSKKRLAAIDECNQ